MGETEYGRDFIYLIMLGRLHMGETLYSRDCVYLLMLLTKRSAPQGEGALVAAFGLVHASRTMIEIRKVIQHIREPHLQPDAR